MDIIINATTLGLKDGDDFKQDFKGLKNNLVYYDIVYNPEETMMMKKLKKKGIKTFNGFEMFVYQGQKSFSLWNKLNPELDDKLKNALLLQLR